MTAVFLDIDGVLCTPLSYRLGRFLKRPPEQECFDPVSLFYLRRLIRRSGAVVVLSSSWRDALYFDDPYCKTILDHLYRTLRRNGTPIADAAPLHMEGDKGTEIAAWLEEHPCDAFAVLDDHDCFSLAPEVRAHWIPVPSSQGLRRRETAAALQMLKQPVSGIR